MKAATINELKKELQHLNVQTLQEICIRLAKYKNENKELVTYLLFEANDEPAYIENVKREIAEQFENLPPTNLYLIKKSIRKILRIANKQIKYSGSRKTEVEIRIYFCLQIKNANIKLEPGTVLYNLYHQQRKKIDQALASLPEDLRYDYQADMERL